MNLCFPSYHKMKKKKKKSSCCYLCHNDVRLNYGFQDPSPRSKFMVNMSKKNKILLVWPKGCRMQGSGAKSSI